MHVILYGATGKAGSIILKELVDRGHTVTAVARTPAKVRKHQRVDVIQGDLSDPAKIAGIVKGADAVVSAYGPPPDKTTEIIGATDCLVQGIERANGPRLIVVSGAGGLPGRIRAVRRLPVDWHRHCLQLQCRREFFWGTGWARNWWGVRTSKQGCNRGRSSVSCSLCKK